MIEIIKPDFDFRDNRGSLTQLVHFGYKQVNIITSVKDAIRGGHYHEKNVEAFFIISGKLKLTYWDINSNENPEIREFIFQKGDMFKIYPFTGHNFAFLEDTVLVSLYDRGVEYDDGGKDIIPVMMEGVN